MTFGRQGMRHVVPRNENLFEFRLNAKHSMRLDEHKVFVKEVLDEGSTTLDRRGRGHQRISADIFGVGHCVVGMVEEPVKKGVWEKGSTKLG